MQTAQEARQPLDTKVEENSFEIDVIIVTALAIIVQDEDLTVH
jgi:hypothetical protein